MGREETNRLGVGCSVFHEKAVKFEIQFISLPLVGRCALGSGFHADSGWWSMFRSNLAQKQWNVCRPVIEVVKEKRFQAMHRNRSVINVLNCLPQAG